MADQYFTAEPQSESRPFEWSYEFDGRDFIFSSDSGVFSRQEIDFGSDLLLRSSAKDLRDHGPRDGRLLDLGCGIGVLGIVLKRVFPGFELHLADVNRRALELTRTNLARNSIKYATVKDSDGWAGFAGENFDVVVTNPPIRAGKQAVYAFFEGAAGQLNPGGKLYVVIRKQQGAASAARKLGELFGNCEQLAKKKGYCVFLCRKEGADE